MEKSDADIKAATDLLDTAKKSKDAGQIDVATKKLAEVTAGIEAAKKTLAAGDGELLFNANCARCHTNGASYGEPKVPGGGFYGPKLSKDSLTAQFPEKAGQVEFITNGVDDSKAFGTGGVNHWSGGGMPYFGNVLTEDQIKAIVDYERSL
jgi:mono/diheme cytochrome c family protein